MVDTGEVLHPRWPGQNYIRLVGMIGIADCCDGSAHFHIDQFPQVGYSADTEAEEKCWTDFVNI